jgi:predicted ATPase
MNQARIFDPWQFGIREVTARQRKLRTAGELDTREVEAAIKQARTACWSAFRQEVPAYLWPTKTMRDRLPDPEAFDAATLWADGALLPRDEDTGDDDFRGIYLFGATGSGKTRTAFELCRRRIERGSSVAYLVAQNLKDELASLRNDPVGKAELLAALIEVDILVLDEFGHTLSDSFGEAVRTILERRGPFGLVVCSQYSPDQFKRRWTDRQSGDLAQHGAAIARRLKEFTVGIKFIRPFSKMVGTSEAAGGSTLRSTTSRECSSTYSAQTTKGPCP